MADIKQATETVKKAADDAVKGDLNPIRALADLGVKSGHLYTAGVISIGLSAVTWLVSRGAREQRSQSDRWGLFIGEWAPTLIAIGIALKHEEKERE